MRAFSVRLHHARPGRGGQRLHLRAHCEDGAAAPRVVLIRGAGVPRARRARARVLRGVCVERHPAHDAVRRVHRFRADRRTHQVLAHVAGDDERTHRHDRDGVPGRKRKRR